MRAGSETRARVAAASVWSSLNQALQALIGVASVLLLSRWLAPVDYGRFAMAAAATSLLGVAGDSGMVAALTRRRDLSPSALATGFWLALIGALALSGISALAAPLIGYWFKDGGVTILAAVLATNFLVAVPSRVPTAQLIRELRFKTLTLINLASNLPSLAVAIALARARAGAWSLVANFLVTFALQGTLGMLVTKAPIRLRLFERAVARELRQVGVTTGGYSFAVTAGRALDPFLAGRFLGAASYGLVGMGTRIVTIATVRAAGAFAQVFLPTLAEIDSDTRRVEAFVRGLRMTLVVVLPVPVGIAAIGPELATLLPPRWHDVQSVLPFLAGAAALEPVNALCVALITSTGRSFALMRLGLLLAPLGWGASFLGAKSGSAAGFAGWLLIWALVHCIGLGLIASFDAKVPAREWAGVLRSCVPCAVMALIVRAALEVAGVVAAPAGLAVGAGAGAVAYVALVWVLVPQTAQQVASFAATLLPAKRQFRA